MSETEQKVFPIHQPGENHGRASVYRGKATRMEIQRMMLAELPRHPLEQKQDFDNSPLNGVESFTWEERLAMAFRKRPWLTLVAAATAFFFASLIISSLTDYIKLFDSNF